MVAVTAAVSPAALAAPAPSPQTTTSEVLVPATPLLSARRVPGLLGGAVARGRLSWAVADIAGRSTPDTCVLVSDATGPVAAARASDALVPASTLKLATAIVAADVLGRTYRWTTSASTVEPVTAGVLSGDLFLVGGGDPVLSTSGFVGSLPAPTTRAFSALEALADGVAAAGVRRIEGRVLGDDSRFDSERAVATWDPSYLEGSTVGSLGALRVNRGLTGWAEEPQRSGMRGDAGDPVTLAADTFVTLLGQRGVEVVGGSGAGVAPAGAAPLAVIESPPLDDVLGEILAWSDNGAAELVLKELGRASGGSGSTAAGIAVVVGRMTEWGLPLDGFAMSDGSGLDVNNRVTCNLLVALLERYAADPDLVARLAVPGAPGTLAGRLLDERTVGQVQAKTGTLYTVQALAGLTAGADGRPLRFAWVANGPRNDLGLVPALPDELVLVVRRYPDAPPADQLVPRPSVAVPAPGS